MQLTAEPRRRRLEAERPEDLDHLGALRRLVLGRRAHRSRQAEARRHQPVPGPDERTRASRCSAMPTIGDEQHQPGLLRRRVRARRLPGRRARAAASSTSPRRSTSSASPCSRSRRSSSGSSELVEYVRTATRDGEPLRDDPHRAPAHRAARDAARGGARARACASSTPRRASAASRPPSRRRSTSSSRRSSRSASPTRCSTSPARARSSASTPTEAPLRGRAEMTYRYSVIDTIGGGASEIQKNIIARRKLGLPKNF